MLHQKIVVEDAIPFSPALAECEPVSDNASLATRLTALLIIAVLPFMILAFVVRFVWSDIKMIGRGLRFAFRVLTEELSRKP